MRAILAAITLILSLFPAPVTARAATNLYGRADTDSAYFYTSPNDNAPLFAIPETYCVRIIYEEDGWYHVQYAENEGIYQAVYGYIRTENLTLLSERPEVTYLDYPVEVRYTAGETADGFPTLAPIIVTAAYYGVYYDGPNPYSYLLSGNDFGYVAVAYDDYPRIIPAAPAVTTPASSPVAVNVKLIVAVALTALAAGVLLYLYFSGKHNYLRRSDNRQ